MPHAFVPAVGLCDEVGGSGGVNLAPVEAEKYPMCYFPPTRIFLRFVLPIGLQPRADPPKENDLGISQHCPSS